MWHRKWLIALIALACGLAALGLSLAQPTMYSAEGSVLLTDPQSLSDASSPIGPPIDPGVYTGIQAAALTTPEVFERASQLLDDGTTPSEVAKAVDAVAIPNHNGVVVTAIGPTAGDAVDTVNAVVQAYGEDVIAQVQVSADRLEASLTASISATENRIAALDDLIDSSPGNSVLLARHGAAVAQLRDLTARIEQLPTDARLYGTGVLEYRPPTPPSEPFQPMPTRNAAIFAALGAIGAGIWSWWRFAGDHSPNPDDEVGQTPTAEDRGLVPEPAP